MTLPRGAAGGPRRVRSRSALLLGHTLAPPPLLHCAHGLRRLEMSIAEDGIAVGELPLSTQLFINNEFVDAKSGTKCVAAPLCPGGTHTRSPCIFHNLTHFRLESGSTQ